MLMGLSAVHTHVTDDEVRLRGGDRELVSVISLMASSEDSAFPGCLLGLCSLISLPLKPQTP